MREQPLRWCTAPRTAATRRTLIALTAVVGLLARAPSSAETIDPFYSDLLREGSAAHARGDFDGAAKRLRIASFGMLDEPELLAETLVRLSVVHAELGQREAFRTTFDRIVSLEELHAAYARSAMPDDLRSQFEARILDWVPAQALRGSPTFGQLVRRQQLLALESMAAAERRRALERMVGESPGDLSLLLMLSEARLEAGEGREALDSLEPVLAELPNNKPALCLRARAQLQVGKCSETATAEEICNIRQLPIAELEAYLDCLTAGERWMDAARVIVSLPPEVRTARPLVRREKRIARQIPEGAEIIPLPPPAAPEPQAQVFASPPPAPIEPSEPLASRVPPSTLDALRRQLDTADSLSALQAVVSDAATLARRYPNADEPQFLAGEAAYRASDWKRAAEALSASDELPRNRPELHFYLAVSLYELGEQARAAAVLRPALDGLQRTRIVERYLLKILGQGE